MAAPAALVGALKARQGAKALNRAIPFLLGMVLVLVLFVVVLTGKKEDDCAGADTTTAAAGIVGALPAAAKSIKSLNNDQLHNAQLIIAQGRRDGVGDRGIIVALATALQESRLRNYANNGQGTDLRPEQRGVGASMRLPHEAVGTDHGSIGIFQQQWPWWGTMRELMDPGTSASKFYAALKRVRGYERLPVTVAAQRVQRSAFGSAYADDEPLARELLAKIDPNGSNGTSATPSTASAGQTVAGGPARGISALGNLSAGTPSGSGVSWDSADDGCAVEGNAYGATGTIHWPLPVGSFTDRRNWHTVSSLRASWHTGTDLSSPCGTKVMAANSGRVIIRTDQAWAGPKLVQVQVGPGKLTTWYAHMRRVDVTDGQQVTAGQPLGEVGSEGNSTGCHLHFEVHEKGGAIYGADNVNASTWLKNNVGRNMGGDDTIKVSQSLPLSSTGRSGSLRLISFNILGDSHFREHPGMARGGTRAVRALRILDSYRTDVAGLQEAQGGQRAVFMRTAGGRYGMYPTDNIGGQNAIVWNTSTMQALAVDTVKIPYFHGKLQPMPVILFRQKATGKTFWVMNVHNPANVAWAHRQQRWRNQAIERERTVVSRLLTTGRPVFLTGDLNDRRAAFCPLTAGGLLTAPQGGGNSTGGCRMPRPSTIDWVFGAGPLTWTGYHLSQAPRRGPMGQRTSDHPIVVTESVLR